MRGSERFTQRASTAITKAHDAALGMGHSYVGTEHILLGIIREGEGLGARILADNALTDSVLTRMVTETVGRGVPGTPEHIPVFLFTNAGIVTSVSLGYWFI